MSSESDTRHSDMESIRPHTHSHYCICQTDLDEDEDQIYYSDIYFLCLWFVLFYHFLVPLIVRGNSKGPTIKNFEGGVGKEERLGDLV